MPSRPSSRATSKVQLLPERKLLKDAATLQQAQLLGGALPPLLRGRQLALLSEAPLGPAASLFRQAATELGARVATLEPGFGEQDSDADIQALAGMLGRLYEAIECDGLAEAQVRRLAGASNVPVFDGLAGSSHLCHALARRWRVAASLEDKQRWLIQAALLLSLD